jgi:hypothetical protein
MMLKNARNAAGDNLRRSSELERSGSAGGAYKVAGYATAGLALCLDTKFSPWSSILESPFMDDYSSKHGAVKIIVSDHLQAVSRSVARSSLT